MSGVSMDEMLYCEQCKKITLHHTDWDSEHESDVYAQCEHFGPRMLSGMTEPRAVPGKHLPDGTELCYWFLLPLKGSK